MADPLAAGSSERSLRLKKLRPARKSARHSLVADPPPPTFPDSPLARCRFSSPPPSLSLSLSLFLPPLQPTSQNPSRKADDGWTSCKYRGTLLSLYRPRLEELIASGLGNAPALPGGGSASASASAAAVAAAATPKTSSPKQSRPRPRTSAGTAIDSELAGNMTMGGTGNADYDSDLDDEGRGTASVGNGTILSRSPPRGATSAGGGGGGGSLSRRGSLGPAGGGGGGGGQWPGSSPAASLA